MEPPNLIPKLPAPGLASLTRTWKCPDEMLLAAYAERRMDSGSRQRLESHLAGCDYCLSQVACLVRLEDQPPAEVPPALIVRAERLAERACPVRRPVWQWGAIATVAACLLVAAGLWVRQPATTPTMLSSPAPQVTTPAVPPAATPGAPPADRTVRGGTPALAPEMLSPRPDSSVTRQDLEFRWKAIPGSLDYEVRVVSADGELLWQGQTAGTAIRLPDEIRLNAGQKYFVWIGAHLPEGKTLQSRAAAFTIKNP